MLRIHNKANLIQHRFVDSSVRSKKFQLTGSCATIGLSVLLSSVAPISLGCYEGPTLVVNSVKMP
jgi:hypothetical protein